MISGKKVWRRFRTLWRLDDLECEITAELLFHIEMRTLDNIEAGMTPEAASEDARQRFGDVQQIQDACRRIQLGFLFERLAKGIRPFLWVLGSSGWFLKIVGHIRFAGHPSPVIQHLGDLMIIIAMLALLYISLKERNSRRSLSKSKKNILFSDDD